MKLLAIDTSESVARWVGVTEGGPLEPRELKAGKKHDTLLAPGVRRWLDEQGWEKPDAVAVVHGPGGFTGLRVGVAFATGLAEAWGVKMVPISLYERLAAMVEDGLVWAVAWGGRDDVRARLMQAGDLPTPLSDVNSCSIHNLTPPADEEPVLPLGEGYQRNQEAIDSLLGPRLRQGVEVRSAALALAFAAKAAYDRGILVPPTEVDVDYGAEFVPTPKKKG
ncbi:tRNA (adenosine(37)-N6)-threonylcarbamoyltransferase complex dimerization subunit type 1 TsaB [bacterium]|nr:tRNA (adenosine(37)-N6)-threonylcarbamoyltransferase complex dimerization subunit type 1 TsaB [bacterium]